MVNATSTLSPARNSGLLHLLGHAPAEGFEGADVA
jgi:hypothetical protein